MDSNRWSEDDGGSMSIRSRTWSSMRSRENIDVDDVDSPFPALEVDLSRSELRETAYEVLVCASLAGGEAAGSKSPGSPHSPAQAAVQRLKKALSKRSRRKSGDVHSRDLDIARSQMEISERRDGRIRKALSKAAAHGGNRPESLLVPVELLLGLGSSEFSGPQEYLRWLNRQLKVIEAGLLIYPASVDENTEAVAVQLRKAIADIREKPNKWGKNKELVQALRSAAFGLAGEGCCWAKGFPMNIHLYDMLLRSLFDSLEEGSFIFEIDQVMDLVKKTWGILGITNFLHHVCFVWVLVRQFMITGQKEAELLRAAEIELREAKACKPVETSSQSGLLTSVLSSIQSWSETRLLAYHEHFDKTEIRAMEGLVSVSVLADEVLNEHVSNESKDNMARARVHEYIQSSVASAFSQMHKELLDEHGKECSSLMVELAKNVEQLASEEEELFSPKFIQWHVFPARLASTTLHTAYMREFKHYLGNTDETAKEVMQALEAAASAEKKLMRMAMENSLNSLEFRLPSVAADPSIDRLLKEWLQTNLQQLGEWVERNVQQEEWSSDAVREHYALSGVEVLRMVENILDAFFALPVYENPVLLADLINGVDSSLELYATLSVVGCDAKQTAFSFEQTLLPASLLRNSSVLNKVGDILKKRSDVLASYRNKVWPQLNDVEMELADADAAEELEQLCVRMNTLYYIHTQMEFLEKKIRYAWLELGIATAMGDVKFSRARQQCQAGTQKLYEYIAYRMVYCDGCKRQWELLYSTKENRIKPVIEYLNSQLLVVAETSSDWLRDRVVRQLMKSCFEAYAQVVAYRSLTRTVQPQEIQTYMEDFAALQDLFKADGEGLEEGLVDNTSQPVLEFLKSLSMLKKEESNGTRGSSTGNSSSSSRGMDLEVRLRMAFARSRSPPVPQGLQYLTNTNAFATMVGYKCHSMASKFVKKSFDFSR